MPKRGSRIFPALLRTFGVKPDPSETRFSLGETIQPFVDADSYDPDPEVYFNHNASAPGAGLFNHVHVDARGFVAFIALTKVGSADVTFQLSRGDPFVANAAAVAFDSDGNAGAPRVRTGTAASGIPGFQLTSPSQDGAVILARDATLFLATVSPNAAININGAILLRPFTTAAS